MHTPPRCRRAAGFTYTPILVLRKFLEHHLSVSSLRRRRPLWPRADSAVEKQAAPRDFLQPAAAPPRLLSGSPLRATRGASPVPHQHPVSGPWPGLPCVVIRWSLQPGAGGRLHRGPDAALVWTSGRVWRLPFGLGVPWARESQLSTQSGHISLETCPVRHRTPARVARTPCPVCRCSGRRGPAFG